MLDIETLHITTKAIFSVVADGDGFVLRVIAQDAQDGAENFLARDGHVVGDRTKNCRLHEVALFQACGFARAAGDQLGAGIDAFLNQILHLGPRRFGNHRSHAAALGGIAGSPGLGDFFGDDAHFIQQFVGHQHARGGTAGLSRIHHDRIHPAGDRSFEIRIF